MTSFGNISYTFNAFSICFRKNLVIVLLSLLISLIIYSISSTISLNGSQKVHFVVENLDGVKSEMRGNSK